MRALGNLRKWQWIVIVGMLALITLGVLNIVLDRWAPAISLVLGVAGLALSVITFRLLWKQSDHLSFHQAPNPEDRS